ncbi:MAG TPA: hypothetical protein VFB24_16235, partial [Candidatus Binatia bacterium]|nr:hypothetical protein [Candidatus Binatia bacterium]
ILILMSALQPFILGKSLMRKRARTDLRGGRPAMVVPTATPNPHEREVGKPPTESGRHAVRHKKVARSLGLRVWVVGVRERMVGAACARAGAGLYSPPGAVEVLHRRRVLR